MGWSSFLDDAEDDIKSAAKYLTQIAVPLYNLDTGELDIEAGLKHLGHETSGDKKNAQLEKANANATSARQIRMNNIRTQNFNAFFGKTMDRAATSAGELMSIAANGGFEDSSAVQGSLSSTKAQLYAEGKSMNDTDAAGELAAYHDMWAGIASQKAASHAQSQATGIQIAAMVGGAFLGPLAAGAVGAAAGSVASTAVSTAVSAVPAVLSR